MLHSESSDSTLDVFKSPRLLNVVNDSDEEIVSKVHNFMSSGPFLFKGNNVYEKYVYFAEEIEKSESFD